MQKIKKASENQFLYCQKYVDIQKLCRVTQQY